MLWRSKSICSQAFLSSQMKQSKTPNKLVNNKQKTTSRFYRKNTVKVRFRGSKEVKKLCFGGRIYKGPGFLSTQMKQSKTQKQLVNNKQKTTSRFYCKNTVKVRFRGSKGVKQLCVGGRIYRILSFLSTQMRQSKTQTKTR